MTRIFVSLSFGLLWLLALWWFGGPLAWAPLLILVLCSALAGFLFHVALGAWLAGIERCAHNSPDGESRTG
jgi:fatty acid desaturase